MRKKFNNDIADNSIIAAGGYQRFNATLNYTFKPGDGQRLSKDGILTVYNFSEPIEIPVTKLLGKWKESHIGIVVVIQNGEWVIEKETLVIEMKKNKKSSILKVGRAKEDSGILKYKPLNIIRKIFNKRMNNENLLPDM